MKLHAFICASPLYPDDQARDQALHCHYLDAHIKDYPREWVELTVIQNGCEFSTQGLGYIRNPFPKNIAYNWLMSDANCTGDYWLFVPEDCLVSQQGWEEISVHMEKGNECFALSKDPKAIVGRQGIFRSVPSEILTLCDMNVLGKEIACVVLRGELDRQGFHCITKSWQQISANPKRWGNELYAEMNARDHPYDVNKTRALPIFQDYGLDGWKAPTDVIEATFMKIVEKCLAQQRQAADTAKRVISHYGPLITEVPYRGLLRGILDKMTKS